MMAGVPTRFWRELAVVLAAKTVLLALLYIVCFSGPAPVTDLAGHLFAGGGPH
jgi:hypothetical protein